MERIHVLRSPEKYVSDVVYEADRPTGKVGVTLMWGEVFGRIDVEVASPEEKAILELFVSELDKTLQEMFEFKQREDADVRGDGEVDG